jgi:hypothetical protein
MNVEQTDKRQAVALILPCTVPSYVPLAHSPVTCSSISLSCCLCYGATTGIRDCYMVYCSGR